MVVTRIIILTTTRHLRLLPLPLLRPPRHTPVILFTGYLYVHGVLHIMLPLFAIHIHDRMPPLSPPAAPLGKLCHPSDMLRPISKRHTDGKADDLQVSRTIRHFAYTPLGVHARHSRQRIRGGHAVGQADAQQPSRHCLHLGGPVGRVPIHRVLEASGILLGGKWSVYWRVRPDAHRTVQEHPGRPRVGPAVVDELATSRLGPRDLGGEKARRPALGCRYKVRHLEVLQFVLLAIQGATEVDQHKLHRPVGLARPDHDVVSLDVAVDDAVDMQVDYGLEKLFG